MAGLFGGGAPKPPPVPPPTPMPDLNDPAILAARQRAAQMDMARSGRASTVLTGGQGGDDYSASKLGSP